MESMESMEKEKEIDNEISKEINQEIDMDINIDMDLSLEGNKDKKKKGKIKKYLFVVWPFIVVILVTLLFYFCLGIASTMVNMSAYWPQKGLIGNIFAVYISQYINFTKMDFSLLMMPVQIIWIVVFLCWYRRIVEVKTENSKRFFRSKSLRLIILLTVGNYLLISGAMDFILPYLGKLGEDYIRMMDGLMGGNNILLFISSIILAPIAEELICRGVIMKQARDVFPFAVANILQAFLFGLMHGNLIQGTYAFVLGLSLGFVTYKYKTLIPAILIHCMSNLLGSSLIITVPAFLQIIEMILGVAIIISAVRKINKTNLYEVTAMN